MRILWFINGILPVIAEDMRIKTGVNEGWLVGLSTQILKAGEHSLSICFPQSFNTDVIKGCVNNIFYYGYPLHGSKEEYDAVLKKTLSMILLEVKPDIIHLMGSEYPHCFSMISACEDNGMLGKAVISIQGLISVYAGHTTTGIPSEFQSKKSLKDILRKTSLRDFTDKYRKRGEYEVAALKKAQNIIGRTTWDFACTAQINPARRYFFNNETLRPSFYQDKWDAKRCEAHSIFFSQATTPIKGFHFMLEAMPIILNAYPDTKLYVAAYERYDRYKGKLKLVRTQYQNFICSLIEKYNLERQIVYCGSLNEQEMKKRFLCSNVFVSASTIENSPNSVGEAMLLGVPVVVSDVGGVRDLIRGNSEGLVYSVDAPYMLAHHVMNIFSNQEYALDISKGEIRRAESLHNPELNYRQLISIYENIHRDNL